MIIYYFNDFEVLGEAEIEQMLSCMPFQQQEAMAGTKLLSRRREIAVSYLMLAYAIGSDRAEIESDGLSIREFQLAGVPSDWQPTLNFTFGEHGKPYLSDREGVYFNISHCKEAIAVGVSDREIGIDIEGRRRYSGTLLQRVFADEEQESIRQNAEPEMEFARLWTRKEAFFKWTGTGILLDHIKSVEQDAEKAGCTITTQLVTPAGGGRPFFLSIAC